MSKLSEVPESNLERFTVGDAQSSWRWLGQRPVVVLSVAETLARTAFNVVCVVAGEDVGEKVGVLR